MQPDPILERIRSQNERKERDTLEHSRHQQTLMSGLQTQETILRAFRSLIDYMDKKTTKTEVVNQLESIGTPDALKVADAVNDLHETLKTHQNTDLTEITDVMKSVLKQAEQIPKEVPSLQVPSSFTIDNLPDHSEDFKSLREAIEAIKVVAEAPVVNVPAPEVNVSTDLNPLLKKMTEEISVIKKGQAEVVGGALQTQDISGLITEKYTRFNVSYERDEFSDENAEKLVSQIKYYNGNKLVATLKFSYSGEDITGVKKI